MSRLHARPIALDTLCRVMTTAASLQEVQGQVDGDHTDSSGARPPGVVGAGPTTMESCQGCPSCGGERASS